MMSQDIPLPSNESQELGVVEVPNFHHSWWLSPYFPNVPYVLWWTSPYVHHFLLMQPHPRLPQELPRRSQLLEHQRCILWSRATWRCLKMWHLQQSKPFGEWSCSPRFYGYKMTVYRYAPFSDRHKYDSMCTCIGFEESSKFLYGMSSIFDTFPTLKSIQEIQNLTSSHSWISLEVKTIPRVCNTNSFPIHSPMLTIIRYHQSLRVLY